MPQVLKEIVWPKQGIRPCPECKVGTMVVRTNSRTGELFVGCSRFPHCKWTMRRSCDLDCCGRPYKAELDPEKLAKGLYGVELDALRTGPPVKCAVRPNWSDYDPEDRWNRADDPTDTPCVWGED